MSTKRHAVIIVAAGSSRRAGFDKLTGMLQCIKEPHPRTLPVLAETTIAFLACKTRIEQIILVCSEDRYGMILPYLLGFMSEDVAITRVDGGSERHFSVAAGLKALKDGIDFVSIHDGARPLVNPKQIIECLDKVEDLEARGQTPAVALAHPVVETMKRADASCFSDGAVDRTNLWVMETPQVFSVSLIKEAYARVLAEGLLVTDEVSALESMRKRTFFLRNMSPIPNLKITYAEDLALAQVFVNQ